MYDKLLESLAPKTTLASGTTDGQWVYVGVDRDCDWRLTVGGDITGTNPTLDVTIQGSIDGVGAQDITLATFTQVTVEMVGYVNATPTPRPEVPGSLPLDVTAKSTVAGVQYPWQRVHAVVGGTSTPLFPLTSCDLRAVRRTTTVPSGGAVHDATVYLA